MNEKHNKEQTFENVKKLIDSNDKRVKSFKIEGVKIYYLGS